MNATTTINPTTTMNATTVTVARSTNITTVTMARSTNTTTVPAWAATTTMLLPTITPRRPRGPRLGLLPVLSAMASVLLGLGPNFNTPVLAADTATPTRPAPTGTAAPPAAPLGPPCGPGATPAGHNPPVRVEVTTAHTYVPAGWLRWCTGRRESLVGPIQAAWIVMRLDRAQATVTTTALIVAPRDFAEAYSANPWMYITPRGYTESV